MEKIIIGMTMSLDGFVNDWISIAPTLLGEGLKFFERINAEAIELKSTGVIEYSGLTDLRYRIVK